MMKYENLYRDVMCSITESALDPAKAVSRLSLGESRVCKKCPSREVSRAVQNRSFFLYTFAGA